MLTTVTSTALLEGLEREGDDGAWREFCVRYQPVLLALARRSGLRDQDARDVVQETLVTFLEAFREGQYDRERGRLRSWLKGIIVNKIRSARRRLARQEVHVADSPDATSFMNRIPDDRELADAFEEEWERGILVECLSEARRQFGAPTFLAFELCAMRGWPAKQVAAHVGIAPNTVYVSKNRVLSRLRELRREMGDIW